MDTNMSKRVLDALSEIEEQAAEYLPIRIEAAVREAFSVCFNRRSLSCEPKSELLSLEKSLVSILIDQLGSTDDIAFYRRAVAEFSGVPV